MTDAVSEQGSASGLTIAYSRGVDVSDVNVSGIEAPDAYGYFIAGANLPSGVVSTVTLTNCTAERCGISPITNDIATGFYVSNPTNNIIFKNCIANGNGLSADAVAITAGFLVYHFGLNPFGVINNIDFDNCVANGNGNGIAEARGGFVVLEISPNKDIAFINNVAIQKSVAKFNNGSGISVTGRIGGASINESEVYQNTDYGILAIDNLPFFVSRNVAYANGALNYLGVPQANIVEGTTANLPNNPGFLNVSIINA